MKRITQVLTVIAVFALALTALALPQPANAQGGTGTPTPGGIGGAGALRDLVRIAGEAVIGAVTEATGLTGEAILRELIGGKSMATLVTEAGKDLEAVKKTALDDATQAIDEMVTAGTMTAALADRAKQALPGAIDRALNIGGLRGAANEGNALQNRLLQTAATQLLLRETSKAANISQRDMLQQLREGKSLSEIATAAEADTAAILSAASTSLTEQINTFVTNGRLEQAQADSLLAELPKTLETIFNQKNLLQGGLLGRNQGRRNP